MIYKYKIIFLILFSSTIYSQQYTIIKIVDANIFKLNNNQLVSLYGINIPSIKDTNSFFAKTAEEIIEWENYKLLNKEFLFNFITKDSSISIAKIFVTYALGNEDISHWFLSKGYGYLQKDNSNFGDLLFYEKKAIENEIGLWSKDSKVKNDILAMKNEENKLSEKKYTRPYLSFLFVSAASFALAWDFFSSAKDIQNTIDAIKEISNKADVSDLESSKSRKTIVGIACLAAGIVTTLFSFKKVEIKSSLNSINVTYNF